ncbi:MAG TPA: kelch repeat-containing protein [Cyclobacteriaceae bacterium]|nr:kelch repeat-containing protein [Cyclobacteriaceae bacterium]
MKIKKFDRAVRYLFALLLAGLIFLTASAQNPATPPARAHHEMVYDPSTKSIIMAGGSTPRQDNSFTFFDDVWRYNINGWMLINHTGDQRSGIRLAYDSKIKKIYSFGGFTADNQSSGQLRVLEGNQWKTLSDLPDMKAAEPGFVYDSKRDMLIAFGGSPGQRQVNNATWQWDGSIWTKIEAAGPPGRQGFAMVFDKKRGKTLVYGGMDGNGKTFEDGLWEFDGAAWSNVGSQDPNPGPRLSPGYCYDSKRGLFILFGGISKGKIKGDTWGWDGGEWKMLAEDGPPARMMGYIAYDENRDRVVLFGGRLGWPNDTDDTWEFDGEKWHKQ